jgi:uroporphyrinogen decarboxylase
MVNHASTSWSKRLRLETCLGGGTPDRVPVALWRHFPVDDQTPETLAAATLDFQERFDFDFVKVTPSSSFCLRDWGAADIWQGSTEGTRTYTHRVIQSPDDWYQLPVLDPYRGALADQLTCLNLLVEQLKPQQVPVLQTIFSPLSQAKNLVGGEMLLVHLRRYPDAVRAGLRVITESTLRFLDAALSTGVDGVFYAIQHASDKLLSLREYQEFARSDDLQVLSALHHTWLNMLHLHGEQIQFDQFCEYPIQVINWHDRDTAPSLAQALGKFSGAVCGGLQREHTMVLGNPVRVTAEAHDAIQATRAHRFILGTGCVLPITAPRANILAARQSVGQGL